MTTKEMEFALVEYFNPRINLIVPNVSWGWGIHECDLLIITKAGYAWEIEIKISKKDLVADKKKHHSHQSPKIKYLYFAIPEELNNYVHFIPNRAGIILCKHIKPSSWDGKGYFTCETIRQPHKTSAPKLSWEERYKLARLGTLRMWALKNKKND
jgi:hypothetical protein